MTNKAIQLYRDFLRVMKQTMTKDCYPRIKRELRYHFHGNSLLQCDTDLEIKKGYRIIEIIKERSMYKRR